MFFQVKSIINCGEYSCLCCVRSPVMEPELKLLETERILSFDLELSRDGRLLQLGAVLAGETLNITGKQDFAIEQLELLSHKADFVLGHNILDFDLTWLSEQRIRPVTLLDKPVIDTLYLSPLAFPANPYHRLVKNYKLVRDSINDPVNDARLALQIFLEQLEALKTKSLAQLQLYQYLFEYGFSTGFNTKGLVQVFSSLTGVRTIQTVTLPTLIKSVVGDHACPNQLLRVIGDVLRQPRHLLSLAFASAWLPVSGGNSVLPPWVWHRFPYTATIIHRLREEKCNIHECQYCSENHDARKHLQRIFELDDFRLLPDGTPLQKNIVECGLAGRSLLGILPTSGGKSLCYQLPAIVHNQRNASLTIVISPLQALMKDQVDNLKQKAGIEGVAAISGMLPLPERGAILEQVRMGDIAILYISPEQLRNKAVKEAIRQRQIGGWVFDEAHCLSKWGHDFRPDYLYSVSVIETIAHEQQVPVPSVYCYTATAKLDVINDICQNFQSKYPYPLERFEGGVERNNLHYEIIESNGLSKISQIITLLDQFFGRGQPGSCIIYGATKRSVDEIADALIQQQRLPVARFYARLDNNEKKEVLEKFIAGEYRVVCATNAFGMGIDKNDVRLVIHAEIPGSLENYLQEAGRAGRDTLDAHCILLFDEQDIEKQFRLQAISEVSFKDIRQIFRGVKFKANDNNEVVATSAELINQPSVETSFTADDNGAETKVKTGIAWLERVGYIERTDNITQVFQGKVNVSNLDEAESKINCLNLNPQAQLIWNAVLQTLFNADVDEGISADGIAEVVGQYISHPTENAPVTEAKDIMRILTQMADLGLISKGVLLSVHMRPKGKDNARIIIKQIHEIELAFFYCLQEEYPDAIIGISHPMYLRNINQLLIEKGYERSNTSLLRNLLYSWSQDGKRNGLKGSVDLSYGSRDSFNVILNRPLDQIEKIIRQRQVVTNVVLEFLYQLSQSSDENSVRKVLLSFSLEQVIEYMRKDVDIVPFLQQRDLNNEQEWLIKGAERALLYMHEQHAITLQNGLAVFRSAMTLRLCVEKTQRYVKADYQPLEQHYHQKILQIHVMNEYARLALDKLSSSRRLVKDYFSMDTDTFVPVYFKGRRKILELATSEKSWKNIVEDLHNNNQEQIVQAPLEQNMLVLAGPGSGKSKVIIHRCAYLMRVKQIAPSKILLLCYNHNAAVSLRRRLKLLLGRDGSRVSVHTFHGLALRITGHSFTQNESEDINFQILLEKAIALLRGEESQLGLESEMQREHLLGGLEFLLVDEYQDIDAQQYQLIAALAGKNESEDEARLNIMAVGDDDQSIYGFRDANVTFIRRFESDYLAKTIYLTWNYRSTANIISCANRLIEQNTDRMKSEHPITIDSNRLLDESGGKWASLDPSQGKVIIQSCLSPAQQAAEVVRHIRHINKLDPDCPLTQIAVLARNGIEKTELMWVRSALIDAQIPCRFSMDKESGFSVRSCKEIYSYLSWLKEQEYTFLTPAQLREILPSGKEANRWHNIIHQLIDEWESNHGSMELPAIYFASYLQEYFSSQKRQVRFGNGVLLSTVHGVKGEEFNYVIILDGGWQKALDQTPAAIEEERRLFYVGMTRAISRLVLMKYHDLEHPYISDFGTDIIYAEAAQADPVQNLRRFAIIGPKQLFISYAAVRNKRSNIHHVLESLKPGDNVSLVEDSGNIKIIVDGESVCQLSHYGKTQWKDNLGKIKKAKILAMIRRTKEQVTEEYKERVKVDEWLIPILLTEI